MRHAALPLPTDFSCEVLGTVTGLRVLAAGAGPNTLLGQWVTEAGGRYTAMDKWKQARDAQAAAGHIVLEVTPSNSITDLLTNPTVQDHEFDVGHARFVICHLYEDCCG